MELKYGGLTDLILKSFYNVFNELGYGFLEKVYENALLIELEVGLVLNFGKKPEFKRKIFSNDNK
jgi:hypothetical protein